VRDAAAVALDEQPVATRNCNGGAGAGGQAQAAAVRGEEEGVAHCNCGRAAGPVGRHGDAVHGHADVRPALTREGRRRGGMIENVSKRAVVEGGIPQTRNSCNQ
jgi:hypothetical protein